MIEIKDVSLTTPNVNVRDALNLKFTIAIPITDNRLAVAISNRVVNATTFNEEIRKMAAAFVAKAFGIEVALEEQRKKRVFRLIY